MGKGMLWFLLCAVVLGAGLCALVSGCNITVNAPLFGDGDAPLQERVLAGEGDKKILMIPLEGLISSEDSRSIFGGKTNTMDDFRRQLDMARQDPDVAVIMLRVDSPGGEVDASDVVMHELERFKTERKVPIIAFYQGLAASGAYYISMAADEIIAQPTTLTGSIGVVSVYVNVEKMMEKVGVEAQVLRSGDMKGTGMPFKPLDEKAREYYQSVIMSYYENFLSVVQRGRKNMKPEAIRRIADGRVYTAQKALEIGLVDRIGYFHDALDRARELAGDADAQLVTYTNAPEGTTRSIYTQENQPGSVNVPLLSDLAQRMGLSGGGPRFLYLWSPE